MTNLEILIKAIHKILKEGMINIDGFAYDENSFYTKENQEEAIRVLAKTLLRNGYYQLIFSHEFAKYFWGGCNIIGCEGCYKDILWQYHLQQMVLEENPLDYLKVFLE
jgi:hypothetical protein